jgi:hypothetical protein
MEEHNSPDASRPSLSEQFASDPWPVVGFTTTEHNNLTSRRGTLTSETTGRVAAYLSTLSASLVALGFVGGGSGGHFGDAFFAFGAVALALTALVGIVTFLRCLQGSVEDVVLGERVERVRRVYLELLPSLVDYLEAPLDTSHGDASSAAGMTGRYRWQLALTMAGLVTIVNSALIGLLVGFLLQLWGVAPEILWPAGALVALLSAVVHFSAQQRSFTNAQRADRHPSLDG